MIVAGLTTLLQTTFGLRLSILQGPAFAFIPPLLAFSRLPEMRCDSGNSEIDYIQKLQIISGSVAGTGIAQLLLGATGLIGFISKRVGPLTITVRSELLNEPQNSISAFNGASLRRKLHDCFRKSSTTLDFFNSICPSVFFYLFYE